MPQQPRNGAATQYRTAGLRLALLAGLLLWLSCPPLTLWPLAWVAVAPLIIGVVRAKGLPQALWRGYLFGWVYLAASLVPPVESRLPTARGLACLGTMRIWPPPAGLAYFDYDNDGTPDPSVARAILYVLSTGGGQ